MHRIRFDDFIHNVITYEPNIKEPVYILQRIDFKNGYGEELLATHLRILGRTLISESGHRKITLNTFENIAKSYENISNHDLTLAYSIITPENETHISFIVLKKFLLKLTLTSLSKIMKTLYKDTGTHVVKTYDLRTDIPENMEKSISILESETEYSLEAKQKLPNHKHKPKHKAKHKPKHKPKSFCQYCFDYMKNLYR